MVEMSPCTPLGLATVSTWWSERNLQFEHVFTYRWRAVLLSEIVAMLALSHGLKTTVLTNVMLFQGGRLEPGTFIHKPPTGSLDGGCQQLDPYADKGVG